MASTSTRPDKRPRTESSDEENTQGTGITRSEPWFFDGTIVLEAERTQFRVHKGVLAASSAVFKDMFEVCQTGEASADGGSDELVDGCHVVHMSDAARDVQHVLKALYERDYYTDPAEAMPLDVAAAFLRIGKKYDIGLIYSQAMLRFTTEFPSTLAAFDKSHEVKANQIKFMTMDPMRVVNLAYETQTLRILPAAWYSCCASYELVEMVDGDTSFEVTLSPENLRTCVLGRETLLDRGLEYLHTWLSEDSEYCYNPLACTKKKKHVLYKLARETALATSLRHWDDHATLPGEGDLCLVCYRGAVACYERGRQKLWDELPTYFGLPAWDVLLKD